jgi:hypothetical protein
MKFLNHTVFLFALLAISGLVGRAQSIAGVEETGIVYRKTRSMGVYLHSRGTGLSFRRGINETGFRSAQFDFSLQTVRHPKEIRSVNPFSDNAIGYIYGKRNSIVMLRTGWGKQFILHPEGDKGGVETGFCVYGGATWALLKPVYLNVYYFDTNFGVRERTERYDPMLHYPDNISGRAPFLIGIDESRFSAGVYGNLAMQFEFGRKQQHLRYLEAGVATDFMARPIEIMANNPAERLFITLYIRLMYGKLWNRDE